MIKFTILIEPVAQGRPRAKTVNVYAPKKSLDFKRYVSAVAARYASIS